MSAVLTDPSIPANFGALGLTPQERAALDSQTSPAATISQFKQQNEVEQSWLEQAELQRIQAENQQLREQVGNTATQLQEVRSGYDQMSGQLSALQLQQQADQSRAAINSQYELTQEEIDNHGEILPIVNKLVGKTQHEIQAEVDRRLAVEKQRWQEEATAPLMQQLEQTQQQVAQQAQISKTEFETRLVNEVSSLGFGDIATLTSMPEFQHKYQQPAAPGITEAWGDVLRRNIDNRNLNAAAEMLRHFRDNDTNLAQRDDTEVLPGRATSQPPLTSQESAKLQRREQLTAIYQNRMEQANQGRLPAGWDRAKYRAEQMKLKAEIDSII